MNFNLGDKVKIIGWKGNPRVGQIGQIDALCPLDSDFVCVVSVGEGWSCAMKESEIEPVARVGQQLLFSFME